MDRLSKAKEESKGDHSFEVFEWDNSENWRSDFIEKLGDKVKEVYGGYKEAKEVVEEESELGFETDQLEDTLESILEDVVPSEDDGGFVHTPQADLPEIVAAICLEELYSTEIPVDVIEARDTQTQPKRGIDVIGYEKIGDQDQIQLILSEVKGSSSSRNPPQVVTGKDDSLDEQLKELVLNENLIKRNLTTMFRQAKDGEDKKNLLDLLTSLNDSGEFTEIILCPFLVRELEEYEDSDYKPLKEQSEEFEPYTLRFLAVCLDAEIEEISKETFEYAREGEIENE